MSETCPVDDVLMRAVVRVSEDLVGDDIEHIRAKDFADEYDGLHE